MPLAPCDKHPDGRSPLKPKLPFPFANCYHWIGPDMVRTVRVKTRAYTEYDEGKAILLPGIDHVELEEFFHDDLVRCARAMQAEAPGDTTQLQHEAHEETSPEPDGKPATGEDASHTTARLFIRYSNFLFKTFDRIQHGVRCKPPLTNPST